MVDVSDWYGWLSEPVRRGPKPRVHYDHFNRNAAWFNGVGQSLRGWYSPLTEPRRFRPPLQPAHRPYLVEQLNYVQYRFSIAEAGDSGAFTYTVYVVRNLARVSITEMPSGNMARVSIEEDIIEHDD